MEKRRMILAMLIFAITAILLSCNERNIGTDSSSDSLEIGNIKAVAAQKSHGDSPQKVFSEFQDMRKKVETMSKAEIDSLSDEEVLKLGEPILKATEGTIKFSEETLQLLQEPNSELIEKVRTITPEKHNALSEEIKQILASDKNRTTRNLSANNIQELLRDLNGERIAMMSTCESMFNVQNGDVLLDVGDNFDVANGVCPAGSDFIILPGTHTGQRVTDSKNGNTWSAYTSAIMDGQHNLRSAFDEGMDNNMISLFTIKRYTSYGIESIYGSDNVRIQNMTFKDIAPSKDGEYHGAVRFDDSENIRVRQSYFEDVAAGVLFTDCNGPLKVNDNEALNSGRNFVQLSQSSGTGIRINGNSLDRTSSYGNAVLEDWISIFKSSGTSGDPIQVNNNRARGHSSSGSGSFIMLGDYGGDYQEAVDNIGVNPGQVGIGAHGGDNMYVADNKMYSEEWSESNVAFSSYNATSSYSCSNHDFENNTANWTCGDSVHCSSPPTLNDAWANNDCDLSYSEINTETTYDYGMDETVWNEW